MDNESTMFDTWNLFNLENIMNYLIVGVYVHICMRNKLLEYIDSNIKRKEERRSL